MAIVMGKSSKAEPRGRIQALADQALAQHGQYAEEYAEARAEAAEQLGAEVRSEDWEKASELIERRNEDAKD